MRVVTPPSTDLDGVVKLLCFTHTFVNIIGYGFFGILLESTAHPAEFAPEKSEHAAQMKKMMIEDLESGKRRNLSGPAHTT